MAPNLASTQHDLIHDMIVDKKLKTRQMADVTECSERSIKAIRSNLHYFGTTKTPLNGGGRPRSKVACKTGFTFCTPIHRLSVKSLMPGPRMWHG